MRMVEKVTVARPYAKAAFEFAREHGDFVRWSTILAAAAAVVHDSRVAPLLSNPRVQPSDLVELIAAACGDALNAPGRNFLSTLSQNRRLGILTEVAAHYEELRAEMENVVDVHVTSAVELNDSQREQLMLGLQRRLKREVRLHCAVDAGLIGGAVVRAGDFVIDGSLKARLERLASQIMH
jgi:F-type H+-transporting ATPase subunit delta